jgi:hypothetical protein
MKQTADEWEIAEMKQLLTEYVYFKVDFSPVYRCLHIYTVLGERDEFEKYYRKQRRQQSNLVSSQYSHELGVGDVPKSPKRKHPYLFRRKLF